MTKRTFPGDELRQRREEIGLRVDDVFRKLRIPTHVIEALEAGDIERLPALCYAAGFLKTYCQLLNLDGEGFVDALHDCNRSAPGTLLEMAKDGLREGRPRWLGDMFAWATISAILILGWATYSVVFQPKIQPEDSRVQAGVHEIETQIPQRPPLR